MEPFKRIALTLFNLMSDMESHHKLVFGICTCIFVTIIILGRCYILSTTALERDQMLIEAGQSKCQQTIFQENILSNQKLIIMNSDIHFNNVSIVFTMNSVQVIKKHPVCNDCQNGETPDTMAIIEIDKNPINDNRKQIILFFF